jgi:hypothetical protein
LFISFRGYLSLILFIDLKYEKLKDETKVRNEKKQTQKQYKPERKTNTTTL